MFGDLDGDINMKYIQLFENIIQKMKIIHNFKSFKLNENKSPLFKELKLNNNMMYQTSAVINLIPNPYDDYIDILGNLIKTVLDNDIYEVLFKKWEQQGFIRNNNDLFILFVTTVIDVNYLRMMFNNIKVQEGADGEEEFVSALEINNKIVLLLHSPKRGSSIRIQDDNYTISFEEVKEIIKKLCEIYNQRL